MAWHPIDPAVPGEVIAAAWFNEQVGDNLTAIRSGGIAVAGQVTNDLFYASSATTINRFAPPAVDYVPLVKGTGWTYEKALGQHEMFIPAAAFRPHSGAYPAGWHQSLLIPGGSTYGEYLALPFRWDTTSGVNDASAWIVMPKAWDAYPYYQYQPILTVGTGAGGYYVAFAVNLEGAGHGQSLGVSLNGLTPTGIIGPYGPNVVTMPGFTTAGIVNPGAMGANMRGLFHLFVRRYYGQYGDDFKGTVYLLGMRLLFNTNRMLDV